MLRLIFWMILVWGWFVPFSHAMEKDEEEKHKQIEMTVKSSSSSSSSASSSSSKKEKTAHDKGKQREMSSSGISSMQLDIDAPSFQHLPSPLINRIVSVTKAHPDLRRQSYHKLSHFLNPILTVEDGEKDHDGLKAEWTALWTECWKEPEDLIDVEELKRVLKAKRNVVKKTASSAPFDQTHSLFEHFREADHQIDHYEKKLLKSFPHSPQTAPMMHEVETAFQTLRNFYNAYVDGLIVLSNHCLDKSSRGGLTYADYLDQIEAYTHPKAVLMSDLCLGQFYRIDQKTARHMLSLTNDGKRLEKPSGQNHHVPYLPYAVKPDHLDDSAKDEAPAVKAETSLPSLSSEDNRVYFKSDGMPHLQPGREAMVHSLYNLLTIPLPQTGLVFIDHVLLPNRKIKNNLFSQGYNIDPFCVQASYGISGKTGNEFWKESTDLPSFDSKMFDLTAYAWQTIGALLSYPSDGKLGNFIVKPLEPKKDPVSYEWISIDNDEVFAEPVLNKRVHLKSVLFTLLLMDHPLPLSLINTLQKIDPDLIVLEWLHDLHYHNQAYGLLYHQIKQENGLRYRPVSSKTLEDLWFGLSLPIELTNFEVDLPLKGLKTIQSVLKDHHQATLHDMLVTLEPQIGNAYKSLRNRPDYTSLSTQFKDPYTAFLTLYGDEVMESKTINTFNLKKKRHPSDWVTPILTNDASHQDVPILDQLIQDRFKKDKGKTLSLIKWLMTLKQDHLHDPMILVEYYRACSLVEKLKLIEIIKPLCVSYPDLDWRLTLEGLFPDFWNEKGDLPQKPEHMKGPWLKKRIWSDAIKTHLFDDKGQMKRGIRQGKSLPGRSLVNYYPATNPIVYFKEHPELPGYEYAATLFMRMMGVESVPYNEPVVCYHPTSKKPYVIQIQQAMAGDLVCDIWNNNDNFKDLEPYQTGLLILSGMLINPEDGKEDNYILTPDRKRLIPIDNDHAFIPGTVWRQEKKSAFSQWEVLGTLQTKTLLFCLDMMTQAIPDDVRSHFLNLKPDEFLKKWLNKLVKINDDYQKLDPNLQDLYERTKTILRIPVAEDYIKQVHWKMHLMQERLKGDASLTYLDLLEMVEPYIARIYKAALTDPLKKTVKDRFLSVTKGLYQAMPSSGNRLSAANSRSLMEIIKIPEKDLVDHAMTVKKGPSTALDVLKKLKREREKTQKLLHDVIQGTQDLDHPLECSSLSAQEQKQRLDQILAGSKVLSVLSIHDCTILTSEYLQMTPQLKEIGVHLTCLDLRGSDSLNEIAFQAIYEMCSNLEYLNMSGWTRLWYLQHHEEVQKKGVFTKTLVTPSTHSNKPILRLLKRLVVKDCPQLEQIHLCLPSLLSLEVDQNPKLKYLNLHNQSKSLIRLSLEQCPELSSKMVMEFIKQNPDVATIKIQGSPLDQDVKSQYLLGLMYRLGIGVPSNYVEAIKWYKKAIKKNHDGAQNDMGYLYEHGLGVEKNYPKAIKLYEKAANQNNETAQSNLAIIYENGLGVPQDYNKAKEFYEKAANQNNINALNGLGWMYMKGIGVSQDYIKARELYEKSANQNDPAAQCNLAAIYSYGWGVPADYTKSRKLYEKAADQGYAEAQCLLGHIYLQGFGIPKDYNKAKELFEKAAEQNHSDAQAHLGHIYFNGVGVPKDYVKARESYEKVSDQNFNGTLLNNLGFLYHFGQSGPQDYVKARQCYEKAIAKEIHTAYNNLGLLYQDGLGGLEQKPQKAMELYIIAAQRGINPAHKNIAWLYQFGLGIDKNYEKAVEEYLKGAEQNELRCQNNLGFMYHYGLGVPQDHNQARSWYEKAIQQGSKVAKENLEALNKGRTVSADVDLQKWYQDANQKDREKAQLDGLSHKIFMFSSINESLDNL